jgi:hypothetical protein
VEHQGVRQGRQVLFYLLTLIGGVGTVAGFLFALAATGALRLWGVGAIIAGIGLVARLLGLGLGALGAGLLYSGWRLLGRYLAS